MDNPNFQQVRRCTHGGTLVARSSLFFVVKPVGISETALGTRVSILYTILLFRTDKY
jgi:hypothetical protein